MDTILSRIQEISRNEGITISAMERSIGASKGVLSRAIVNRTDIQTKWIQNLVENYPQYSTRWLLTGQGSMLRSDSASIASVPSSTIPSGKSDAVILRLMDKLDEKDTLLKEKETKIDQLQSELRSVEKELAILKERNAQCDLASDRSKGLDSAKNVSTSKRSSSKTDDAGSADAR